MTLVIVAVSNVRKAASGQGCGAHEANGGENPRYNNGLDQPQTTNIWTCHDASPEGNGVFYAGKTPCKHRQGHYPCGPQPRHGRLPSTGCQSEQSRPAPLLWARAAPRLERAAPLRVAGYDKKHGNGVIRRAGEKEIRRKGGDSS